MWFKCESLFVPSSLSDMQKLKSSDFNNEPKPSAYDSYWVHVNLEIAHFNHAIKIEAIYIYLTLLGVWAFFSKPIEKQLTFDQNANMSLCTEMILLQNIQYTHVESGTILNIIELQ